MYHCLSGRNEWADYQSSSLLLCVLDGSPVSVNGARGPLMRDTGVHLCGLNERGEPTLFGLLEILWEKRNMLFPHSQRESDDAAWMREGDK